MFFKKGKLFILSAPSGGGKTTLCNKLLQEYTTIKYSVSYTTRTPREGEIDGVHYHFVSTDTFKKMIENNEFIEHAVVHGNMYGTSKKYIDEALSNGNDILLDIDPQGALQIRQKIDYGIYIFIIPPSMKILKERLEKRGEKPESLQIRLKNAKEELLSLPKYDYAVINDNLATAYANLSAIYRAEHCKVDQIDNIIKVLITEE